MTGNYLSDRQRIERAVIPGMLLIVAGRMAETPSEVTGILDRLGVAVREAYEGLEGAAADKVARRALRSSQDALTDLWTQEETWAGLIKITRAQPGSACGKAYLAVCYAIKELVDSGVIEVGGAFGEAWDLMKEGMEPHWDDLEKMDRSAEKAAKRILQRLNQTGLFTKYQECAA